MTKEQYETLNSICCTLDVLSYAGKSLSGLAYDMSQMIIPAQTEPPVRSLRATIPDFESH